MGSVNTISGFVAFDSSIDAIGHCFAFCLALDVAAQCQRVPVNERVTVAHETIEINHGADELDVSRVISSTLNPYILNDLDTSVGLKVSCFVQIGNERSDARWRQEAPTLVPDEAAKLHGPFSITAPVVDAQ